MEFMKEPISRETNLRIFNPIFKKWFFNKFKDLTLPQQYSFYTIHSRQNILVSSPTGSGKTLSAFGSILNELTDLEEKNKLEDKIYAVYISPLKALNNDIQKNLQEPLKEMEEQEGRKIKIRLGVRTGDTTQYERAKMAKNPPHILITTPESLAIMLSSPKFRENLRQAQWVIVDEIHSLAENKRGTHLSLSLERLENLSQGITRIGLSATVAPIEEVAKFLVGKRDCKIVDVQFIKSYDFQVISPVADLINTSQKELQKKLYLLMDKLIQQHKTTLIFTNTRAATERIVHNLKEIFPKNYSEEGENKIGAHHGSLSKQHRLSLENRLKEGKLKAVVCSTSLELGIDIGDIDLVLCIGSPKSVARLLQRCLPYDEKILTSTGEYLKIGDIVEKRLPIKVISYDEKGNFVTNTISEYQKNIVNDILEIELKTLDKISCTGNHPILTKTGWKNASKLKIGEEVGTVGIKLTFKKEEKLLIDFLPKEKFFVENKDQFFHKIIKKLIKDLKCTKKDLAKFLSMPYAKLIDYTRISGRKKSIRLDYFMKVCKQASLDEKVYFPYLQNLKTRSHHRLKTPLYLTKEIMWLAGIIASEGCIVKTKTKVDSYFRIKIGNMEISLIQKATEIMQDLGFKCHQYYRDDGFLTVECGSHLIAQIMFSLGIPCKNKTKNVKVDDIIFSLSNELQHSFIEGVFEGDGNFNEKTKTIRIFTASKEFAICLRTLFTHLGYKSKILTSKSKTSKLVPKINHKDIYCVYLARQSDVKQFFKASSCFCKKAKYSRRLSREFKDTTIKSKDYTNGVLWSPIIGINKKSKQQTYNLTLNNPNNNFIVGNIITHNSGRAGHSLNKLTKARLIVSDRDDLVECSVMLKEALEKKIDRIHIPRNALDVLAQHIVGMATETVWKEDDLFKLIKKSYCYETLKRKDFSEVLDYLAGKYVSLEDRYVYAKIWREKGNIGKKGMMTRVIYMTNIGTIPDETSVQVKLGEAFIGNIDEGFLERLKPGDIFVLGGEIYEFRFSRGMTAQVKTCYSRPPTVPSWFSEQLPLSYDLAIAIGKFRGLMDEQFKSRNHRADILKFINKYLYVDEKAANAIYSYMKDQYDFSGIPTNRKILIEHYHNEKEKKIVFHTLYGRRVNDCLSRAIAFSISATQKRDVEVGIADNGFYVKFEKPVNIIKAIKQLTPKNIERVLDHAIDKSEALKRRFRHCATRSFMILKNYKGREKKVGRQQMGSMVLMKALRDIDPNFTILREAKREVLEDVMDIEHTKEVMEKIQKNLITFEEIHTQIPSPFAFNLVLQGHLDILKLEDKAEFLKRMHEMVKAKISLSSGKDLLGDSQKIVQERGSVEKQMMEKFEREKIVLHPVQERLINKIRIQRRIPRFMKLDLVKLIKGAPISEFQDFVQSFQDHKKEALRELPSELSDFILTVLKEREKFDIKKYCLKIEKNPNLQEQLKKDNLIENIKLVCRRNKLEDETRYELMDAIEGKKVSKETKKWLKEFIKGTVPKYASDDLVKLFKIL